MPGLTVGPALSHLSPAICFDQSDQRVNLHDEESVESAANFPETSA
ncbi:MAG TPA: hypothetical protein VGM44_13695 [Polyangiaceae bacterium]